MAIDDNRIPTIDDLFPTSTKPSPREVMDLLDRERERRGDDRLVFFSDDEPVLIDVEMGFRIQDDISPLGRHAILVTQADKQSVTNVITMLRGMQEEGHLPVIAIDSISQGVAQRARDVFGDTPMLPPLALHAADSALRLMVQKNREALHDWGTVPLKEDSRGFHMPDMDNRSLEELEEQLGPAEDWPRAPVSQQAISLLRSAGLRASIASTQA